MKRRSIIILLLLLLSLGMGGFFLLKNNAVSEVGFKQQGTTEINSGAEIKIWDYQAVDGDTVDFYFDGKLIFERLGLTDTPKVYQTGRLSKGKHWIGIRAVTEGFNPPATPHISINDGKNTTEFDIESSKDSLSGSWIINVH